MSTQLTVNFFKAMSHPTRLDIIKLLRKSPLCVCDIFPQIDAEQSNTSQHLSILKNQGILESEKDGTMVIYRVKDPEIFKLIELAEKILIKQIDEAMKSFKNSK